MIFKAVVPVEATLAPKPFSKRRSFKYSCRSALSSTTSMVFIALPIIAKLDNEMIYENDVVVSIDNKEIIS